MRVLMVSKALVVASYRSKLRELTRLGADMIAVIPDAWREEGSDIRFEVGPDAGYEIIKTTMAWNGHFHLHYYPALDRIVRSTRPDIIHVDEEPYNLATFLAIRSGVRAGARPMFFTWQNIHRRYPPPFRQMEKYAYSRAAHAQCGSPEALDVLRRKGFNGPATVLPQFGVDIDRFPFEPKQQGPFTVGYLGRLVPEKGIHDLMSAFNTVHPPTRLIVAGDGPLSGFVDAAAVDLKRQSRFERFPRIPSTDVAALMRRLDALVLPSQTTRRWREQYGRILIEAMASGVVVVGSESGEIPNVIRDAGVVVPERDPRALSSALNQLADSPDRRAELVSRGRERAVKLFSQAGVAAATFQVYEQILASRDTPVVRDS